ncbi:hypothetical protein KKG82_06075 [Patescibacteria group bacterium]|nr:hypothetical protein [Patescibacteria group bacterium]
MFSFIFSEVEKLEELYSNGDIGMLPIVFHNQGKADFIVIDYNFLVLCLGRFIEENLLGVGKNFIEEFRTNKDAKKTNNYSNQKLLTHFIFEIHWRCAYVNGLSTPLKFMNYSVQCIFENYNTAMQIGAVMFSVVGLKKALDSESLVESLLFSAKMSEAVQVAFGTSKSIKERKNVPDWWKANIKKYPKKLMYLKETEMVL